MLIFSIAFLFGNLLLHSYPNLPSNIWIAGAIVFCLLLPKSRSRIILLAILSGFAWCLWYANATANTILPVTEEGKQCWVQGTIASLPRVTPHQTLFLLHVHHHLVRLTWPHPSSKPRVGDEWSFPVVLKRIHTTMNIGGFDYEAWAFQNNIRASGVVVKQLKPVFISHHQYLYVIDRMRQYIQEQAERYLPASQTSPWIIALMTGERNGIPVSEWEVLRKTGTNHLMAIAGLHIGFMSAFSYALTMWIWKCFPRLILIIPAHLAGAYGSLIVALFYSVLAGFSIPTQRACIMVAVLLITTLNRRIIPGWQSWSLALLIVLLVNPLTTLSSSFWLSFTTIALILYGLSGRIAAKNSWWKWGRPQWVITVGLLPLSVWIFTQYSLVSFFANAIAIPWVGFLVLPFCFVSIILLLVHPISASLFLILADKSLMLLWLVLTWFSHISWATWTQSVPHIGYIIAAIAGIFIILAPGGFPVRIIGLLWVFPLVFFKPIQPAYGELQFTLLDVGQGLSAVIQTQHHVLVYDTGARFSAESDMGKNVVLPFLNAQGIKQLDMLVVSHGDNDHSGGAPAILQQIQVQLLKTSVPDLFPLANADYCLAGTTWQWDGVIFSFLHPSALQLNQGNNSSCVLQIKTEKRAILIPGDIEKEAERVMLANPAFDLAADIIVAPHHGSKTSAVREFIGRVHPQYVLYSTGYHNRFHFPHVPVVEAYRDWGVVQYDTAVTGSITFKVGRDTLSFPELYRMKYKKYWHTISPLPLAGEG